MIFTKDKQMLLKLTMQIHWLCYDYFTYNSWYYTLMNKDCNTNRCMIRFLQPAWIVFFGCKVFLWFEVCLQNTACTYAYNYLFPFWLYLKSSAMIILPSKVWIENIFSNNQLCSHQDFFCIKAITHQVLLLYLYIRSLCLLHIKEHF